MKLRGARRLFSDFYQRPLHVSDVRPGAFDSSPRLVRSRPLISVLIPTHNRVKLLTERCLPSVQAQTYRNFEVIVAAHGCTDGTELKAAKEFIRWARQYKIVSVPRVKTYPPTVENHWFAGPVAPLNAALGYAGGLWLARIDDDDVWTPDHLESLLHFAQAGDYEFVSSAYRTHERTIAHDGGTPPIGGTQTWLWRSYLSFFRWNPDCWRRSRHAVNDTDLADRFRKAGVRIGWLDKVTAEVSPRPGETDVGLKAYRHDPVATAARYAFK